MIYLDSAATSFQKPEAVDRAMRRAMRECSSPGRGGYPAAMAAAETVLQCRMELQSLFDTESPEQIVFTMNATHALNIAIKSLVKPGARVVISGYEHNAVTRPLAAIGAETVVAGGPLFQPAETLAAFDAAITPGTAAVVCTHVSNVFGYALPLEQIAALCRERGVPLIVDASQSAGVLPLNLGKLGAAFLAMPGHKGLYGPQGTGVLVCGANAATQPLLEGGTGSQSILQEMPSFLPDRLEAGTHNVPGIAGLLEGVRFVRRQGLARICRQERKLAALAVEGLHRMPGVEVFAGPELFAQTGVVSFRCRGQGSEEVGNALAGQGIAVRAGLHCAPLAHRSAGTIKTGTVRASFSAFSTQAEVLRFLDAVRRVSPEKS